jgi:hypothetical protein
VQQDFWRCLGERETGAATFVVPAEVKLRGRPSLRPALVEVCRSGIRTDKPLRLALRPIMADLGTPKNCPAAPKVLLPGAYRVRLLMLDPVSTAPGQRVFEAALVAPDVAKPRFGETRARIDVFERTGAANRPYQHESTADVGRSGKLELVLTPIRGQALLCGVIVEPVGDSGGLNPFGPAPRK